MKHKQTLRRGLSILLSLVLCLGLLPAAALADEPEPVTATADFTTDAEKALKLLNAAKTEGAADSEWDSAGKKLTLKGVDFTTAAATAVKLPDGSTIVLADGTANTITSTSSGTDAFASFGIDANGTLDIVGSGTLTATGGKTATDFGWSYGIHAIISGLTISGTAKVTATGGEAAGKFSESGGIQATNLTISGAAEVTAAGGKAAGEGSQSSGVDVIAGSVTISGTAKVTATGGEAAGVTTESYGIYSVGNVTISGGAVTAQGGKATGEQSLSYGILDTCHNLDGSLVGGNVTISRGSLTAAGGEATAISCGINAKISVTISGGSVEATGSTAGYSSRGIYAYGTDEGGVHVDGAITIKGGHVIAQTLAGTGATLRAALGNEPDLSGYASYKWRAGPDDSFADTAYPYSDAHTYVEFTRGDDVVTYTVSFDANGGSGSMDAVTVYSDENSYTLPECGFTAPEGQQFKGWAASENGEVITDADIIVTGDTTLYAVWEEIPDNETADFTTDAEKALKLLNAAKTEGAADSEWDSAGKKLTLKGVDFTTAAPTAVKLPDGATIVLADGTSSTITSSSTDTSDSYGILLIGNLTIEGSGQLTVTGGTADSSNGICAYSQYDSVQMEYLGGDITIAGGSVIATGGAAEWGSYGIYADGDITIAGGSVIATGGEDGYDSYGIDAYGSLTITGGSVIATGGAAGYESYGLCADDGDMTISGGTVTATGGEVGGYSYGLCAYDGDMTISGGTVTATAGTSDENCFGIYAQYGLTISGGTIETAGGAAVYSNGIYVEEGDVTISGEATRVTAKGGEAKESSYGIYVYVGNEIISGGTVTATGDTAEWGSYGIYTEYGDVDISGGTVTATGGAADLYSDGIYAYYDVDISGGTVTATGSAVKDADSESYGIESYENKTITISGGHVIARTVAGADASVRMALNAKPDLNDYTGCYWRTSPDASFAGTAYPYSETHTYVEFSNGNTAATYTITFDPNGGQLLSAPTIETDEYGKLSTLPTALREGYTFDGWYTEKTGGEEVTIDKVYTGDTTLYAHWTQGVTQYTITFDPNGGTLSEGSKSSANTDKYGYGTLEYFPAVTREGYTLDGWYTEADGGEKVTSSTVFTADTTIYAHWTPEAQTVQITQASFTMQGYTLGARPEDIVVTSQTEGLRLDGGYFEAMDKPYAYVLAEIVDGTEVAVSGPLKAGQEYMLLVKAYVDEGYDVSGLTKDAITLNGTIKAILYGKNFDSSIGIEFDLPVLKEDDTKPVVSKVTVNGSYASATGAGEYEEGDLVTLAAGSRSGYTFSGWTVLSGNVTLADASSATTTFTMPDSAVTVQANWTYTGGSGSSGSGSSGSSSPSYSVTVDETENGTVTISPKSAKKGATVTVTVTPDEGYELDTLTVTDSKNNAVAVTEKNGKFTFTMPAGKVTVEATFIKTAAEPEPVPVAENPFADVKKSDYYYDAVLWAVENGVTAGTSATTFSPDATCTRAQAVTFLWNAAGSPAPKSSAMPFEDVDAKAYYYNAVLWAVENGITAGTSATTFSPDATCTRAQIVTFLWNSQKSPASAAANPFADVASGAYYTSAVLWAVENGITAGTSATTFSPDANCTRAQIVTFLYHCLG